MISTTGFVKYVLVVFLSLIACKSRPSTPTNESSNENELLEKINDLQSGLTVGELLAEVRSMSLENNITSASVEYYKDFNFETFEPEQRLNSARSNDEYVKVFRDKSNEIVKISKFYTGAEFSYDFIIGSSNRFGFRVMLIYEMSGGDENWINGFILMYDEECYFFGSGVTGQFFRSSIAISNIMLLDEHLKASRSLKFDFNALKYQTSVNYANGNNLVSEDLLKPRGNWNLSDQIPFSDVIKKFSESNFFDFWKTKKIGLVEGQEHLPLWSYGGNHDYYPDSK